MAYIPKKRGKRRINTERDAERKRVYGNPRWGKLRSSYIAGHPLCEDCLAVGVTTLAVDVHHVVSFMSVDDPIARYALAFDVGNLSSVCRRCHSKRHSGGKNL